MGRCDLWIYISRFSTGLLVNNLKFLAWEVLTEVRVPGAETFSTEMATFLRSFQIGDQRVFLFVLK